VTNLIGRKVLRTTAVDRRLQVQSNCSHCFRTQR
jgi:hypothetical protein